MARVSGLSWVALGFALVVSCGGSAFSAGAGVDAGQDASGADATTDTGTSHEASFGGGDGSTTEGGGGDALPDVTEEPPPTCGGPFACVPAVPPGWSGPVELYAGSSPAPPCTPDFSTAYDGNDQLTALPATCSCSCNASATQCGAPSLSIFATSVCVAGTACSTTNLQAGICKTVDSTTGCGTTVIPHMSALGSPVLGGTCSAQAPPPQPPPVSWGTYAQACSSTTAIAQVDCPGGSVCAPKPGAPYGSKLCVSATGNVSCPMQAYTSKQLFYGGVNDTRTCTACTCGSLTGASCAAKLTTFSTADGSCGGGLGISYAEPFSCDAVNQPTDMRLDITSQAGSCSANPVSPTGTAAPANPTTFCCMP